MTPTEYWNSIGKAYRRPPAIPYHWSADSVGNILSRQEYIGDTVNFRTARKSFKHKKRLERPQEEWQIFKDTHPAIIDEETFLLVQELAQKRKELSKAKKRAVEIDRLIQKIYEDNVNGKISDERFATMSMAFEEEQRQIKSSIPNMEQRLETATDKSGSLQRFIDKVKCVTQLTELTPEIIHEFIEKIVVSKPEYIDGKRHQNLKIYYNGVGIVREPSSEEMEELFQEHMQDRTTNQKIKTV